jgi:hypothetical protein
MAEVLFNNSGIPLVGYGKSFYYSTTGGPVNSNGSPTKQAQEPETATTVGGHKVSPWGSNNDFPVIADNKIKSNTVLWSGLKYKQQLFMGQGIFPCKVIGYNDDGSEKLEMISDEKVKRFIRSRIVRRYLQNSYRDVLKFGTAFPELIFSTDGKLSVGINTINAKHCRYLEMQNGVLEKAIVSGLFTASGGETAGVPIEGKDYDILTVLDSYDPDGHLERLRLDRSLAGKNFIYPIGNYFSNNDYYPTPDWWTAYNAGWIDISSKIPDFLKNVYTNQITWLWHVKIPYAYWERKYPQDQYKDRKERNNLIQGEMDKIEESLAGNEGARKALFSMFEVNLQGKLEEQWIIEPLDNKYKSDQQMIESAVADSNILFAIGVNPTVMGAGLPGAGPYAGKTGGSDIRESFLVNVALAWLDRQNILDPIEALIAFNGAKDVELRFRNTVLTTLDTGSGTKTVS